MIDVSKTEAEYLRANGRGKDVHLASSTHGAKKKSYFVVTSPKTMRLLNQYRTEHITAIEGK